MREKERRRNEGEIERAKERERERERQRDREEEVTGSHRVYLHNHLTREQVRGVQNADFSKQSKLYQPEQQKTTTHRALSFVSAIIHRDLARCFMQAPLWGALLE